MSNATKVIPAFAREGRGKGAARAARRENFVPAVIYGGEIAPTTIKVDTKLITQLIYAGHFLATIFEIEIDGKKERVIPRDYQLHVVNGAPLHIDFFRLKKGANIRVDVPLHVLGQEESPGIKEGGIVNLVHHKLELRVPADSIPDSIDLDVSKLAIGDSIHLSAIKLPKGCTPLHVAEDETLLTIAPPSTYEEKETSAAVESAPAESAAT